MGGPIIGKGNQFLAAKIDPGDVFGGEPIFHYSTLLCMLCTDSSHNKLLVIVILCLELFLGCNLPALKTVN